MVKAKVLIDYAKYQYLTSLQKEDSPGHRTASPAHTPAEQKEEAEVPCSDNSLECHESVKALGQTHRDLLNESLKLQNIAVNNMADEDEQTPDQFHEPTSSRKRKKHKTGGAKKAKHWYQDII